MARFVQMYCGSGKGKSAAAIGRAVLAASDAKTVFVISFLKGKAGIDADFLRRMEPDIRLFTFDKFNRCYDELTQEEKDEERAHIRNGLHFAAKVLATQECDVLVLDELLDLSKNGLVTWDDVIRLIESVPDCMELVMTGTDRCECLWPYVDKVTEFKDIKAGSDKRG